MKEYVSFPTLITKGMKIEKDDTRRIFTGHITAEIIDKQQEFIFVEEVMKIMDTFMKTNPVMSEVHTNRMVGVVLGYEKSEINGVASVKITGEVYKVAGISLYDRVWAKILSKEYSGLSMGGASKEREPITIDGRMALELRKLELYEIAICPAPANEFAIIDKVNRFAKAINATDRIQTLDDGRCILKCNQLGMCFEKGTNIDNDVDIDNAKVHEYLCVHKGVCDICGKSKEEHPRNQGDKEEHGIEQFDKPEETNKHHIPSMTDEQEEEAKKKIDKAAEPTLTGRSASTRSDNIGQSSSSPKAHSDLISQNPKIPSAIKLTLIKPPSLKTPSLNKQTVPENTMPTKNEDIIPDQGVPVYDSEKDQNGVQKQYVELDKILPLIGAALGAVATGAKVASTGAKIAGTVAEVGGKVAETAGKGVDVASKVVEGVSNATKKSMTVHQFIEKFGYEIVKSALEEVESINYVKSLSQKYS